MAKTGSIDRHRDERRTVARVNGARVAIPALFALSMVAAAGCGLVATHGDLGLGLAADLVCVLGSAAMILLLRGLRSVPAPSTPDGLTRADWGLIGGAVLRFARGGGRPPIQRLELYRFPRPGRTALVVLVRLDDDGRPLAASTFDVDLQKGTRTGARHGWGSLLRGTRRI